MIYENCSSCAGNDDQVMVTRSIVKDAYESSNYHIFILIELRFPNSINLKYGTFVKIFRILVKRNHIRQFQNGSNQCYHFWYVVPLVCCTTRDRNGNLLRGEWNNIIFDVQNINCFTELCNSMNELTQIWALVIKVTTNHKYNRAPRKANFSYRNMNTERN